MSLIRKRIKKIKNVEVNKMSKWMEHVAATRKKYPKLLLKEILKKAKETYKK
jgi:hypothetical protein